MDEMANGKILITDHVHPPVRIITEDVKQPTE